MLKTAILASKIHGSGAQAAPGATETENGSKRPFWQIKLTVLAPREVCPEQGLEGKVCTTLGSPLGSIESPWGAQDALGALRKAWGGLAGPGQCKGKKV